MSPLSEKQIAQIEQAASPPFADDVFNGRDVLNLIDTIRQLQRDNVAAANEMRKWRGRTRRVRKVADRAIAAMVNVTEGFGSTPGVADILRADLAAALDEGEDEDL
jgi:hypothetical protein